MVPEIVLKGPVPSKETHVSSTEQDSWGRRVSCTASKGGSDHAKTQLVEQWHCEGGERKPNHGLA